MRGKESIALLYACGNEARECLSATDSRLFSALLENVYFSRFSASHFSECRSIEKNGGTLRLPHDRVVWITASSLAAGALVIWYQHYLVLGHGLAFSACIAALPVLTLLVLLGLLRKPAWITGVAGLSVTLGMAAWAYRMPVVPALSAALDGAAFALFPITWIIFWAIVLFRLSVETGQFELIKESISRLTPEPRMQVLLLGFAFAAFLEGATGFGAPVAIASTMLTGLGFTAFDAAAICLLANTAPVAFGSIGIPLVTLAATTGLPLDQLSADAGRLCSPVAFIIPVYLIWTMWGFGSLAGCWIPALAAGGTYAVVLYLVSHWIGPQLTDILASLSTIAVLVALLRVARGRQRFNRDKNGAVGGASPAGIAAAGATDLGLRRVLTAWLPYLLLVVCVLVWGWTPVHRALASTAIAVHWPLLDDIVWRVQPIVKTPAAYHAVFNFDFLAASGTACMTATVLAAICARMRLRAFLGVMRQSAVQLFLPTVTVCSVLAMAFVMNYCGATATLGLAFAATGAGFPIFSAALGWLGVFLTGSDTSANALFGNLQVVTAGKLGFSPVLMAATNSVGGVMGKMISLQTISVAAAATGMSHADQSRLLRFTLRHSVALVVLVGLLALLFSRWGGG